ncbi:MAG: COP9 signalosome complex subunit 12 [Amphiamblys sp. WSBS2006]|nr:MAG: COP9 signalosome complex subunit 12 [Amphiamblys sp. WSBS2006]
MLMKAFSVLVVTKEEEQTQRVLLFVACALFKIYFKLDTKTLCYNVLNVIDPPSGTSPGTETHPPSTLATFWFFKARLCFSREDFDEAEALFEKAFAICINTAARNKREILVYLIVLRLMHGKVPQERLLHRYCLAEKYLPLVASFKEGNIALFNKTLAQEREWHIEKETYLALVVHVKNIVYRNFFKTVYSLCLESGVCEEGRLDIPLLEKALLWMKQETEAEDIECIAANLIYQEYMNGYISHEKKIIVLSKKNPFPSISH